MRWNNRSSKNHGGPVGPAHMGGQQASAGDGAQDGPLLQVARGGMNHIEGV